MKRSKLDSLVSVSRLRSIQVLMGLLFCYLLLMTLEIPLVWRTGLALDSPEDYGLPIRIPDAGGMPANDFVAWRRNGEIKKVSGLAFDENAFDSVSKKDFSELHRTVRDAFSVGKRVLEEIKIESANGGSNVIELESSKKFSNESCPSSVSLNGEQFLKQGKLMVVPCGLTLGSHITLVASPLAAHSEGDWKDRSSASPVSQFIMELQGLKVVDGEDPPRILHFNPRIKGDWSGKPVIEQNTCYRMQWGYPLRCEGWKAKAGDETVDGQEKCEKWIRDDDEHSEESKATWWLKRLIGRTKKVSVDWPYPFAEEKLFVLTLSAGLEGYHTYVDGRHITSFPYRPGFTLEDATGFFVNGDVRVHLVVAASLPTAHPSFAPQRHLEMVTKWQAPRLPDRPVELFIGILSAGNHFSERMAVRKSWMQHNSIKSSKYVARFFVAMHRRKEVNQQLMKEADFFGDIIIVPYLDHYDLVVLKTIAICEYGIRTVGAKYIMKCDDDTFVRVDAVMKEVKKVRVGRSLYVGNMNYYHRPLRHGKWAVKYEEWPKEEYPPYANGPGYILSADIANSIVLDFEKHKLKLFKMEDVSMGMWVEQFNASRPVEYRHSLKFCQFGCIDDYYTSHYQSPRQMICLWNKLQKKGKPQCCNMR